MDITWLSEIKLFEIPIFRYLFHEHLAETLSVLVIIGGLFLTLINWLHNFYRKRRIPLSLKEKLDDATEIYIRPSYGFNNPAHYSEPSQVTNRNSNLVKYFEKIFNTKSIKSRYIILAGSGMGKSSLLFNIYNRYLKKIFRAHSMRLIELGSKDALDEIDKIDNQENTVLLLDALDENVDAISNLQTTIKSLSDKTQKFYRVLITCRTQFFDRVEETPSILTNIGGVMSAGESKKGTYEKIFLYPFSHGQIEIFLLCKYLLNKKYFSPLSYIKSRGAFKKVPHISVRPMLLTYMDYLLKVEIDSKYSFSIYEAMIYGWLQRRKSDELDPDVSENLKFVYYLAIEMARNQSKNKGYYVEKNEAEALAKKLKSNLTDWQISDRSLLNIDVSGKYKFAHLSIMEVLLARAHFNGVDLGGWELSALTKGFFTEMIKRKRDGIVSYRINPRPYAVAGLTDEFERLGFKKNVKDEKIAPSVSEQVEVEQEPIPKDYSFCDMSNKSFDAKNFSGHSFCGSNLSKIRITNTNLTNTDFTGANLFGAIFEKCNFISSSFLGADITSAHFIDCNLELVDFSIVRIKHGSSIDLNPLFRGSCMEGSTVPNNYQEYFREFSASHVSRDFENIDFVYY